MLLRGLSEKRRKRDLTLRYEFGKVEGGGGRGGEKEQDIELYMDYDTFFTMMMMIQELVNIEEKL